MLCCLCSRCRRADAAPPVDPSACALCSACADEMAAAEFAAAERGYSWPQVRDRGTPSTGSTTASLQRFASRFGGLTT